MRKKQSLAAALQTLDPPTRPPPAPRTRQASIPASPQPPSRIGKKALIGYFDPGVSKQLKQMALDDDTTTQALLREALNDFFQKHKKPAIA